MEWRLSFCKYTLFSLLHSPLRFDSTRIRKYFLIYLSGHEKTNNEKSWRKQYREKRKIKEKGTGWGPVYSVKYYLFQNKNEKKENKSINSEDSWYMFLFVKLFSFGNCFVRLGFSKSFERKEYFLSKNTFLFLSS